MLMGVLRDARGVLTDPAKGVLAAPRALLAGVFARLGFILTPDHFPLFKIQILSSERNFSFQFEIVYTSPSQGNATI